MNGGMETVDKPLNKRIYENEMPSTKDKKNSKTLKKEREKKQIKVCKQKKKQ
jgi:hypothetical protein